MFKRIKSLLGITESKEPTVNKTGINTPPPPKPSTIDTGVFVKSIKPSATDNKTSITDTDDMKNMKTIGYGNKLPKKPFNKKRKKSKSAKRKIK